MVTTTRNSLRTFTAIKAKSRKGKTVGMQDKKAKSLLGAAKGKISLHDDLTKPTLAGDAWQLSP